ncbi:MAG TPA: hypothetical protein VGN26_05115 [Armatimonadota bacterium]|jgi:hypothetical protein
MDGDIERPNADLELELLEILPGRAQEGGADLRFVTSLGTLQARFYEAPRPRVGALWLVEAPVAGGWSELAGRLGRGLAGRGVNSLWLSPRELGSASEGVVDAVLGLEFLAAGGADTLRLCGWRRCASSALAAAALHERAAGVAVVNGGTADDGLLERLAPRPLLVVRANGGTDPSGWAARELYERAQGPKRLVDLRDASQGIEPAGEDLIELLMSWAAE